MFINGHLWSEIADEVNCKTSTLQWYRQEGVFGHLPDHKGQRGRGSQRGRPADDEQLGLLFGCEKQDWEKRLQQVNSSWSDEERSRRRYGELPGNEMQYGLRPEHHKDRGNDDWKIQRIP